MNSNSVFMIKNIEATLYQAFDSDPTRIVEFLIWLADAYELRPPVRILDVGCGPGRLLGPLARLGWTVTGLEPNPAFLNAARTRPVGSGIEVAEGGFNDVAAESAFDMVVGINGSFAYLISEAAREDALRRCHAALTPGGILFLDLPNFLRILFDYRGPGVFEADVYGKPVTLTRRHEIDFHDALFTTHEEYVIVEGAESTFTVRAVHPQAILSYPQVERSLAAAGFRDLRTFMSFDARDVERLNSGRMMVAAQRA